MVLEGSVDVEAKIYVLGRKKFVLKYEMCSDFAS